MLFTFSHREKEFGFTSSSVGQSPFDILVLTR